MNVSSSLYITKINTVIQNSYLIEYDSLQLKIFPRKTLYHNRLNRGVHGRVMKPLMSQVCDNVRTEKQTQFTFEITSDWLGFFLFFKNSIGAFNGWMDRC